MKQLLKIFYPLTILLILSMGVGCSYHPSGESPTGEFRVGQSWTGKASYYGKKYHGRTTANGEIFNMHAMTAAHRTLPFGTVVKVTNLSNGMTCEVRINDRGPFIRGRIIDLSLWAARRIDMVEQGVVDVRIEIVSLSRR